MDDSSSNNALNDSPAVEISAKIIVAAVIFLFMVVLFVILLHLYAKWFWWRIEEETAAPPPRRRRRRFVFAPGQDSVSSPGTHHQQKRGLDPAVLKSLPELVFKPEDFKDGLECTVCLSEIVEGEKTRLLPKCNHGFHVDCIDMWFHSHSTCPLCRNLVASDSESSNSKPITTSTSNADDEEGLSRNTNSDESLSEAHNSDPMSDLEAQNFPTNVLVWGNPSQVSTSVHAFIEESASEQLPSSSSSSGDNSNSGSNGVTLVIDLPSEFTSSPLLSPSSESRRGEDEMKSPIMSAKLRSFKRLLSRDKKLSTCSHGSMDVEQA